MTTNTTSAPMLHSTTAGFRAWIIDFHSLISGAGLVQTADTGQIDTATVNLPGGANTIAGYSIWRNSDSSMYFKFQFGNGSQTNQPRIDMQVGEGSNGTGTLTGAVSTNAVMTPNVTGVTFTTDGSSLPSYACSTTNYFGCIWKVDGNILGTSPVRKRAIATFAAFKTVDSSQNPTSEGWIVLRNTNSTGGGTTSTPTIPSFQSSDRSPNVNYTASTAFCIVPGLTASTPANSLDTAGNNMVYLHWGQVPGPAPSLFTCTVRTGDVADLSTFTATLFGATSHTYIMVGDHGAGYGETSGINANYKIAMLYE